MRRHVPRAEELSLKTLEIRHRLFGDEHPNTISTLNNLGGLYSSRGQYAKAEPLLVRALDASRRVNGDEIMHHRRLRQTARSVWCTAARRNHASAYPGTGIRQHQCLRTEVDRLDAGLA